MTIIIRWWRISFSFKEEKMKHYLIVVVSLGFISASCGGGRASGQEPSAGAKEVSQPTGETETAPSREAEAAPETAGAESAETKPQESTAQPPPSNKQESTAEAPPSNKDDVKEAGEARITDKNIVISGKVLFETGNATLKKASYAVLDEVVYAIEKHPEIIKLQVVGHTDSDGDAKANKSLSKRRATSVMNYLIKKGIERDRLSALGEGEDQPIASNDTEEGKDKNRRVEFNIVERAKVVAVTHSSGTAAPGKVDSRKATDDETEDLIKKEGLEKKLH
jgi:outer membrane protein OmpA-like peptidoglycan-associated protein